MASKEKNSVNKDEEERITFNFVLTNIDVQNICKTEDITYYINRQQTKYLAYIARQSNDALTKRLFFIDDKSIKKGRPLLNLHWNNKY